MWSGQFLKAWSKTLGVLALSSGESELAALVRAATEGMGLQSILNDFCLCGHVTIKSDATAASGMVHRLGLGKVRHLAVGDLWVQHHARAKVFTSLKSIARHTIKYFQMACRYPWTELDSNNGVSVDANFAGCVSTGKSTVGGAALLSGQFVKAWSKTMRILASSGGESDLAAVVRAATEEIGLRSILSDFRVCGHVAIKSDATAFVWMGHRLGLGKVRLLLLETCGHSITFIHAKFESPKCQDWETQVMHKRSTLDQNHCCVTRKRAIGFLLLVDSITFHMKCPVFEFVLQIVMNVVWWCFVEKLISSVIKNSVQRLVMHEQKSSKGCGISNTRVARKK